MVGKSQIVLGKEQSGYPLDSPEKSRLLGGSVGYAYVGFWKLESKASREPKMDTAFNNHSVSVNNDNLETMEAHRQRVELRSLCCAFQG